MYLFTIPVGIVMKACFLLAACFVLIVVSGIARTLEVGTGKQYARLQNAAAAAQPGDTILLNGEVFSGGDYASNLKGRADAWITITSRPIEFAVFRGGSQAFHLSNVAYLRIQGLIFMEQTANGVNIDDGGSLVSPSHHIIIEDCEWRNISATGNSDELKISGVDDFVVQNCRFENGAAGGSLVDMVGCHRGVFQGNVFRNGGSNCIQAKGGTSEIRIEGNRFIDGGQRAINIGGSTGLEFFRPQNANYEAKNIEVHSNIFTGSMAPIAFVGAVECKVINNTIIRPTRWAIRILQETTASTFLPCGNNEFRNNIIVYGNTGTVAINVGANTAPETFTFSHNLWFNPDNATWSGPNTPVTETGRILNRNPLFIDTLDYKVTAASPAAGAGYATAQPQRDFFGNPFAQPRSIGAAEAKPPVTTVREEQEVSFSVFPNPVSNEATISLSSSSLPFSLRLMDITGKEHRTLYKGMVSSSTSLRFSTDGLAPGIYLLYKESESSKECIPLVIMKE